MVNSWYEQDKYGGGIDIIIIYGYLLYINIQMFQYGKKLCSQIVCEGQRVHGQSLYIKASLNWTGLTVGPHQAPGVFMFCGSSDSWLPFLDRGGFLLPHMLEIFQLDHLGHEDLDLTSILQLHCSSHGFRGHSSVHTDSNRHTEDAKLRAKRRLNAQGIKDSIEII